MSGSSCKGKRGRSSVERLRSARGDVDVGFKSDASTQWELKKGGCHTYGVAEGQRGGDSDRPGEYRLDAVAVGLLAPFPAGRRLHDHILLFSQHSMTQIS